MITTSLVTILSRFPFVGKREGFGGTLRFGPGAALRAFGDVVGCGGMRSLPLAPAIVHLATVDEKERLSDALRDRYRLDRELGRGGMATVFLAEDLRHRRSVAIKVMDPRLSATLGPARFLREIEIASRLMHPHILGLLDSGDAGGLLYYVMPFVSGDSLRARISRDETLAVDSALRVLREILDALAYAHGQGIVHRDVKPENILFVGEHVQVSDFGVAKALDAARSSAGLTSVGLAIGTPAYMAPEQAAGEAGVDHRADIYALGLVAVEMLTGFLPRERASLGSLPPALAPVITRCLESKPGDRWQSCEIEKTAWPLTEETCRKIDRRAFDPRMIGDRLEYFDNRAPSDVLLGFIPACGLSGDHFASILRATRYRAMALTPFGFEADRKRRAPLCLEDHLVFAREWLRAMRAVVKPRMVVVVGFSSGADTALRLAGAEDVEIDGCLSLGCNLSLETCFLTHVLARVESGKDEATLAALRAVGASASSLDDWINLHEYLVAIARKFRNDLEPLKRFAIGITEPFESGAPLDPFVRWYGDASGKGRSLRAVFEDRGAYPELLKELHLRNIDEKVLGARYEEDSIVIEPDAGHFDLLDPARVERHLDALVARIRASKIGSK
jgi:hypothetical protein